MSEWYHQQQTFSPIIKEFAVYLSISLNTCVPGTRGEHHSDMGCSMPQIIIYFYNGRCLGWALGTMVMWGGFISYIITCLLPGRQSMQYVPLAILMSFANIWNICNKTWCESFWPAFLCRYVKPTVWECKRSVIDQSAFITLSLQDCRGGWCTPRVHWRIRLGLGLGGRGVFSIPKTFLNLPINTTLHPNHPLKICGIFSKSVMFESKITVFWKSVVFGSNTTDFSKHYLSCIL